MQTLIKNEIQKTRSVLLHIEEDPILLKKIEEAAERCVSALRAGAKILFAGNGGSAADAQHLAAELVGRLSYNRPAIAALSLSTDTSALTAIGNDYSFDDVFSRQINALGCAGDVLVAISTSGQSRNIVKAVEAAKAKKILTIGLTGKNPCFLSQNCDIALEIPSLETPKIQECHIMLGHIICGLIEEAIYGEEYNPARSVSLTA